MICLSLRVSGEKNPDCNKMIDQRVDDIKSVIKKTSKFNRFMCESSINY